MKNKLNTKTHHGPAKKNLNTNGASPPPSGFSSLLLKTKLAWSAMPMALHVTSSQYPVRKSQAGASTTMRHSTARNSRGAVMQYSAYRKITPCMSSYSSMASAW